MEVEICATNFTNKTKCMSTNAKKLGKKIVETCSIELAWSRVIKYVCKSGRGCPVIEISPF
jgi:hypothetical protein